MGDLRRCGCDRWPRGGGPVNRLGVLISSLTALAACSGDDTLPAPANPTVRDSAGVRIFENPAPDSSSRLGWKLTAEPLLSIGAMRGDPALELFGVQDALRLDDGRILVANGGTSEVRVYDADGVHQATWGGVGERPGEFTGLTRLSTWPGDSVMAWDFSQNRLTVFDRDGVAVRTQHLNQGGGLGSDRFQGILADGSLITASLLSSDGGGPTSGLVRRSLAFARVSSEGRRLSDLGRHPDQEYYVRSELGAIVRHPFRRSVHSAIWNEWVVISPSDRYEIRAYRPDGSLAVLVRLSHTTEAVTQGDMDRYAATRLEEAAPEARANLARVLEGMPPVERFPAFAALIADSSGDLWVRDYATPGVDRPVWTVFAGDGEVRGLVETPPGLDVYRIGIDYVLGRTVDELGVERVQLWGLDRSRN